MNTFIAGDGPVPLDEFSRMTRHRCGVAQRERMVLIELDLKPASDLSPTAPTETRRVLVPLEAAVRLRTSLAKACKALGQAM